MYPWLLFKRTFHEMLGRKRALRRAVQLSELIKELRQISTCKLADLVHPLECGAQRGDRSGERAGEVSEEKAAAGLWRHLTACAQTTQQKSLPWTRCVTVVFLSFQLSASPSVHARSLFFAPSQHTHLVAS